MAPEPLDPVAALESDRDPAVDILGHCTGRMVSGRGRPPSTFDAGAVFAACAEAGTAVEINARPERLDPPDEWTRRSRSGQACSSPAAGPSR